MRVAREERENPMRKKLTRRMYIVRGPRTLLAFGVPALIVTLGSALAQNQTTLSNLFPFVDPSGIVKTFTTDPRGQVDLTGPFFQNLGTNGCSCGSCHQPSDGWTVSSADVQERFTASDGLDLAYSCSFRKQCKLLKRSLNVV